VFLGTMHEKNKIKIRGGKTKKYLVSLNWRSRITTGFLIKHPIFSSSPHQKIFLEKELSILLLHPIPLSIINIIMVNST